MESDLIIIIKPNGDIYVEAYDDVYEFDVFKAPEVIQKLNPSLFTNLQFSALHYVKHLVPLEKEEV